MHRLPFGCALVAFVLACGSGSDEDPGSSSRGSGTSSGQGGDGGSGGAALLGTPVPAEPQRPGDPEKGYDALVNGGYVSCGVPFTAYAKVFGPAPAEYQLPGRNEANTTLPYDQTRFTTQGGVDVVSANCLTCHAGFFKGQLIVGLGDTQSDYSQAGPGSTVELAAVFLTDPEEKAELKKFAERLKAIEPHVQTVVAGVNPADNLAAVLFAHRDRDTLAWSSAPLMQLPPEFVVPVDVPPWWRMAKKNAMFYSAAGRGDHARIEMTASTLCTDSVEEAKAIDAYFPDIAAYIASITPPKFPGAVDAALASEGEKVFQATCSGCHGTYGPDGSYPNLVVAVEDVGTDGTMITGATQFADIYVEWFNASFYGELARLEPQAGYIAPPLDGVWVTAPYLHNGSVPTIELLLDSTKRPTYWSRAYDGTGRYDDSDYDEAALGWNVKVLDHGQATETDPMVKRHLYDTTLLGQSNAGHTFGDGLSEADRKAVLEYLKTL